MLSVPDVAIIGAIALLVFGPEQLPRIARKVGTAMREVQLTSQQFIREMERAADDYEVEKQPPPLTDEPFGSAAAETEEADEADEPTLPLFEAPPPSDNGISPRPARASEPSEY